jgi:hypothetical protein
MQAIVVGSWTGSDQSALPESKAPLSAFPRSGGCLEHGVQMVVDEQLVFNAWRPRQPLDATESKPAVANANGEWWLSI